MVKKKESQEEKIMRHRLEELVREEQRKLMVELLTEQLKKRLAETILDPSKMVWIIR